MTESKSVSPEKPNYHLVFALLVLALAGSLFAGALTMPVIPVALVFSIAIAKAYLVMAYFMHLRYQPLYCTLILAVAFGTVYCMFLGLLPDMVYPTVN